MTDESAEILKIQGISEIGTSEDGDNIVLGCNVESRGLCRIIIPANLYQSLMTSLFAAASLNYRKQLQKLGSAEAVLNAYGVADFAPSKIRVATGRSISSNEDVILLRLQKEEAPVVDVVLSFQGARQIAARLLEELERGPLPPMNPQFRQ